MSTATEMSTEMPPVTFRGEAFEEIGLMQDSSPLLGDLPALHQRMEEKGYLYLPGFLGRERVLKARKVMVDRLARSGALKPGTDPMDAIVNTDKPVGGMAGGRIEDVFDPWQPIHDVLYAGQMMEFFREFLAAPVLHYDFTWTRQVSPGPATAIHSDVVYMGRGTHQLYTAWTPMGDNDFNHGGLLVLEGSHKHEGLAKAYWKFDVDAACINHKDPRDAWSKGKGGGQLAGNANQLGRSLGGHWVTGDFRMGDVVIFNVYTVHGGTDNHSNSFRLSTDTRYQKASDAVDERWIGEKPPAHGPNGKIEKIC